MANLPVGFVGGPPRTAGPPLVERSHDGVHFKHRRSRPRGPRCAGPVIRRWVREVSSRTRRWSGDVPVRSPGAPQSSTYRRSLKKLSVRRMRSTGTPSTSAHRAANSRSLSVTGRPDPRVPLRRSCASPPHGIFVRRDRSGITSSCRETKEDSYRGDITFPPETTKAIGRATRYVSPRLQESLHGSHPFNTARPDFGAQLQLLRRDAVRGRPPLAPSSPRPRTVPWRGASSC